MKKTTLFLAFYFTLATSLLMSQTNSIKVSSSGKVGINMANPTYQLDISGTVRMASGNYSVVYSGASFTPNASNIDCGSSGYYWYRLYATTPFFVNQPVYMSDEKFKSNIAPISAMKDKLKLLKPVSYNLSSNIKGISADPSVSSFQYGFIAQEFKDVFPSMVTSREDGMLGIRYSELIPVLVQAINEQQEEIDALNKRITELENKIK